MTDLIDRQALLEQIRATICSYCDNHKCTECALDNAIFIINTQGNVEPKKGEWVVVDLNGYADDNDIHCGVCFKYAAEKTNFCPHCGADMKGKKE